jgi:hypothetical protein
MSVMSNGSTDHPRRHGSRRPNVTARDEFGGRSTVLGVQAPQLGPRTNLETRRYQR